MSSGMNLVTTVIGFLISATFIVFICTRVFCCGRARRRQNETVFIIQPTIDLEQPVRRIMRVEPVIVTTVIPTLRFNRETSSSLEDAQCSICLGEYQENEELRIMPKCSHCFHLACIDVWLKKQLTCPVCRFPLNKCIEGKNVRSLVNSPETSSTEHSIQWLIQGQPNSNAG